MTISQDTDGHFREITWRRVTTIWQPSIPAASRRVKTKTVPQPLTEAKFSSIDRGLNSGEVVLKPGNQTGAVAFDVRDAL